MTITEVDRIVPASAPLVAPTAERTVPVRPKHIEPELWIPLTAGSRENYALIKDEKFLKTLENYRWMKVADPEALLEQTKQALAAIVSGINLGIAISAPTKDTLFTGLPGLHYTRTDREYLRRTLGDAAVNYPKLMFAIAPAMTARALLATAFDDVAHHWI